MDRKLSVGVLAVALLLSGLFVGVSYGEGGTAPAIDAPLELSLEESAVLDEDLPRGVLVELQDVDGNVVGTGTWECPNGGVADTCTIVLSVKAGPHTEHGQIVISGNFRGFNGERLAVVGGTGAYAGVGGVDRLVADDGFFHRLRLLP